MLRHPLVRVPKTHVPMVGAGAHVPNACIHLSKRPTTWLWATVKVSWYVVAKQSTARGCAEKMLSDFLTSGSARTGGFFEYVYHVLSLYLSVSLHIAGVLTWWSLLFVACWIENIDGRKAASVRLTPLKLEAFLEDPFTASCRCISPMCLYIEGILTWWTILFVACSIWNIYGIKAASFYFTLSSISGRIPRSVWIIMCDNIAKNEADDADHDAGRIICRGRLLITG